MDQDKHNIEGTKGGVAALSLVDATEGGIGVQAEEQQNPATVVSEVPWCRLKDMNRQVGFPTVIKNLLLAPNSQDLKVAELLKRLLHVLIVESGFIPVFKGNPALSFEESVLKTEKERLCAQLELLRTILIEENQLKYVNYIYIKVEKDESIDPSQSRTCYYYSPNVVTFTVIEEKGGLKVVATSKDYIKSETFKYEQYLMRHLCNYAVPHNLEDYLKKCGFSYEQFAHEVKVKLCYEVLDNFLGFCPEVRGFSSLPNEVVTKIVKYMDGLSFARFTMTSRGNLSLETEDIWKYHCKNIPRQFIEYGLQPPRPRITDDDNPPISYKNKYKTLYKSAVIARRRDRVRRNAPRGARVHVHLPNPFRHM